MIAIKDTCSYLVGVSANLIPFAKGYVALNIQYKTKFILEAHRRTFLHSLFQVIIFVV